MTVSMRVILCTAYSVLAGWAMLGGEVSTTIPHRWREINQANARVWSLSRRNSKLLKKVCHQDARQNVIGHLLPSEIAVFNALPEGIWHSIRSRIIYSIHPTILVGWIFYDKSRVLFIFNIRKIQSFYDTLDKYKF